VAGGGKLKGKTGRQEGMRGQEERTSVGVGGEVGGGQKRCVGGVGGGGGGGGGVGGLNNQKGNGRG